MVPIVRKELDTLLMQLTNWANSYLDEVTGEKDDFLIDDLQSDISTWMEPYVHRLTAVGHITLEEERAFWAEVSEKFDKFVEDVRAGRAGEREVVEEDIEKLTAQFNLHKDLADGGHVGFEFTMEQKVKMGDVARKLIPALERKLKGVKE